MFGIVSISISIGIMFAGFLSSAIRFDMLWTILFLIGLVIQVAILRNNINRYRGEL